MIQLDYFERSDFKQLIDWIDSEEFLLQWGGPAFTYPLQEKQLEKYIENANHENADVFVYKMIKQDTGTVIGHISLGKIDRINKSARIGKVLVGDKDMRGKSIGERMINTVLNIAFEELELNRVSLGVFDFNIAAITCYEKVGFVKEEFLRDARKIGDEYWNLWEMSISCNKWCSIQ
ncbi:GNAT family N-acetyltransferase [Bacillus pseudomycoides]|uniref:GNAT family N-acetyltransferase n=1 Tax=Bacillus pseudomycoides TaxID=64104 RepID=A0AA91VCG0_9BACI|nr:MULTISPECIES: GNAT family protein [Bacillus]PEB51805.1 GNAT family N-acetyltransferase [Bacillus sp. AFS098217]PED82454.1 GNAT family N-acetyltransferase [Bacillus pseudomycoides]PEU06472.1 GNAT family N-acetyltransferase [Bacillus sp. AFS019443]PEU16666.1 GNAT family N-acetyltransferase [Bacillus sp. AFS014408]PFW63991.1 GNAT family N-acetyltransferase [Bacillus sp. AFS075034]